MRRWNDTPAPSIRVHTEAPAVRTLLAILACLAAVFVGSVIFTGVEFLGQDAEQAATTGMV